MHSLNLLSAHLPEIYALLGYSFQDPSLVLLALTHCSFLNESREADIGHNERLELLGDSVLNLLVTESLYRSYPFIPEGDLSRMRAQLVSSASCLRFVQKLKIGDFLLLGKGEQRNDGKGRESILANLFEALLGAIYLDGGFLAAQKFFFSHFQAEVHAISSMSLSNPKAFLQDHLQKTCQATPSYEVVSETGPDHHKDFVIRVLCQQQEFGRGRGSSKKIAQHAAALDALQQLGLL